MVTRPAGPPPTTPIGVATSSAGNHHAPPCSTSAKILAYPYTVAGGSVTSVWCRAS